MNSYYSKFDPCFFQQNIKLTDTWLELLYYIFMDLVQFMMNWYCSPCLQSIYRVIFGGVSLIIIIPQKFNDEANLIWIGEQIHDGSRMTWFFKVLRFSLFRFYYCLFMKLWTWLKIAKINKTNWGMKNKYFEFKEGHFYLPDLSTQTALGKLIKSGCCECRRQITTIFTTGLQVSFLSSRVLTG